MFPTIPTTRLLGLAMNLSFGLQYSDCVELEKQGVTHIPFFLNTPIRCVLQCEDQIAHFPSPSRSSIILFFIACLLRHHCPYIITFINWSNFISSIAFTSPM